MVTGGTGGYVWRPLIERKAAAGGQKRSKKFVLREWNVVKKLPVFQKPLITVSALCYYHRSITIQMPVYMSSLN